MSSIDVITIVGPLALVAIVAAIVRGQFDTVTVFEYERALRFVRGRLVGELGAGRYLFLRRSTEIRRVDTRSTLLVVNGQEVLSKDGVAIKASLTATYRVVDVRLSVLAAESYATSLYTDLQQALRVAISGVDVEALLAARNDLSDQILRAVQEPAARLGLEVERVAIRDLTLPGELKKIFAQVLQARQEGLAALERARGETAALRSLANGAQMMERHPQLMQMRLLQVAEQSAALTMSVGVPATQR